MCEKISVWGHFKKRMEQNQKKQAFGKKGRPTTIPSEGEENDWAPETWSS